MEPVAKAAGFLFSRQPMREKAELSRTWYRGTLLP